MKFNNVKGIVWDLDGTLLDSFTEFENIINVIARENGYTIPSHEDMLENYHGSLSDTIKKVLGIDSAEELDKVTESFVEKEAKLNSSDIESQLYKDAVTLASHAGELHIHQLIVTNRAHKDGGAASPRNIIAATTLADYIHDDAQLAINIGARAILINRNGTIPHIDSLTDNNNVTIVDNLEEVEI